MIQTPGECVNVCEYMYMGSTCVSVCICALNVCAFCTDVKKLCINLAQVPLSTHPLPLLRNASISMNAEAVGEHTVKFEDKALREGIVHMLKGNSSKPV